MSSDEEEEAAAARKGGGDAGGPEKWKWEPGKLEYRPERQIEKHVPVLEPELKALLPIIQGLTRLSPSHRISTLHALELIRAIPIPDITFSDDSGMPDD
ncbi:uncharacterized protein PV06_02953 [Exophiala oligosperma]|uniref:Uncharacterized protein n=1 Tax=Exophiala oligosperma TaxID=215243 RepID=A0A0D2E9B9_9EURO|nr:uncharacterized protein PV06_02953 [Exophiala oligosperma]KIW44489.1 hypothetical protein PV06_02953 [Exophiala oligosperma]